MTAATGCKSPAHEVYRKAVEGLYIQARLAQRVLDSAIDDAVDASPTAPERSLIHSQNRLVEAEDRLRFGRTELAEAIVVVDRHITRGCRNVAR